MNTVQSTFLDWALRSVAEGFYVFPCDPLTKAPLTLNGVSDASNDPMVVEAMWAKHPNANPAIALGPSNLVVEDWDTVAPSEPAKTRRVQTGRVLKPSEAGGFHDYFRGSTNTHTIFVEAVEPVVTKEETDKKGVVVKIRYDALGRKVGKKGVAVGEVRSRGSYVIAPGAVHKSGKVYAIVNDLPLAVYSEQVPEKIYDASPKLEAEKLGVISNYVEQAFEAAGVLYKTPEKYNGGAKWLIDCPWEYQHTSGKSLSDGGSSSAVILLPNGALSYKCQHAHCEDYIWSDLRGYMETTAGRKLQFGESRDYSCSIDGKKPGENIVPSAQSKQSPGPIVEVIPATKKFKNPTKVKASLAEYPLWAWEGTLYEDMGNLCGEGNEIPLEYFIESFKTIIGAIAGHRIQPAKARGQQPARFYTILIGPGGLGKSTAMNWALDAFIGTGLVRDPSQESPYTNIGCVRSSFASDAGMKKCFAVHDRIIQVYDEVTALIAKFSVQGSGDAFLDVVNQLFEYCPVYPSMNTKDDKIVKISGRETHNTILGCTTPLKWRNAFMRTGIEGSGHHQRLNLVSNFSRKRVPELNPPDLREFMEKVVAKLLPLEYQKIEVHKTPEATEMFADWMRKKEGTEHWRNLPEDVKGRINVLMLRNISHLAWLLGGEQTPNPAEPNIPIEVWCDEEIMKRAIALAETEIGARLLHQPPRGDNDYAILENSIRLFFAENGGEPVQRSILFRELHADRLGTQIFDKCLNNLHAEGYLRFGRNEDETRAGRKAQIIYWIGEEDSPEVAE